MITERDEIIQQKTNIIPFTQVTIWPVARFKVWHLDNIDNRRPRYKDYVKLSTGSGFWIAGSIIYDQVLRRGHPSNNILFDSTFVCAPWDLEVTILHETDRCWVSPSNRQEDFMQCLRWFDLDTYITPASVPLVCKKLQIIRVDISQ